jgi:hypothetical protein
MNQPIKRAGHRGPRRIPTNQQRRALRQSWNNTNYGIRSQKDAILWWSDQFGWELKSSTCSDILSAKWAYLDTDSPSQYQLSCQRNRPSQWTTLEAALIEWQIRYDKHPDSGPTTGDLQRHKATEFWNQLPEYQGLQCPVWGMSFL